MIINKEKMIQAIKAVKASLGKESDYYIKDGYLIASNNKCVGKYKLDGETENVRIPAKAMTLISSMTGDIEITTLMESASIVAGKVTEKKETLSIAAGNSKAKFRIKSTNEDLFDDSTFKSYMETAISADILNRAINKLIGIIPAASPRNILEGMNVVIGNDTIEFMACDGVRIGWIKTAAEAEAPINFIIPRDSLKVIESMAFEGKVIIKVGENWITFTDKDGKKILHSRIIDGEYLAINTLFKGFNLEYKANKNLFMNMLDKAKSVAGSNTVKISLSLGTDAEIHYKADLEEYTDSLKLDKANENEKVSKSFNLAYLRDCVNALFDDDISIYTTNSSKTAIVFGDSMVKTLLLPVYSGGK